MHPIIASILPNDLIFDIGAHVGAKSQAFLARGARVLAIDPQPAMVDALNRRFADEKRITIRPVGVADQPGILEMKVSSLHPGVSTFSNDWVEKGRFANNVLWNDRAQAEVTTLDLLIAEYGVPRFLKIDVEGFELKAVHGLNHVCPLSFEFGTEVLADTRAVCERLTSLGYESFNVSFGEDENWAYDWSDAKTLMAALDERGRADSLLWGDVYAT